MKKWQLNLGYGNRGVLLVGGIDSDLKFDDGTFDDEGNQAKPVETEVSEMCAVIQKYAGKVCMVVRSFKNGIKSRDVLINDIQGLNLIGRVRGIKETLKDLAIEGIVVDDSGVSFNLESVNRQYRIALDQWVKDLEKDFGTLGIKYIIL